MRGITTRESVALMLADDVVRTMAAACNRRTIEDGPPPGGSLRRASMILVMPFEVAAESSEQGKWTGDLDFGLFDVKAGGMTGTQEADECRYFHETSEHKSSLASKSSTYRTFQAYKRKKI